MDSMFLGEYDHSVDYKGRVSVPKKFRPSLEKAVLTRGLDKCLFLYPQKGWEEVTAKISKLPLTQANARSFSRYFLSGAVEVAFDSLGRITIPTFLKTYAVIKTEVAVIGVGDRIEIWDRKSWQTYRDKTEKESEDIAEKLSETGL